MHTHGSSGRRRGKPRSRILYWFRTPPGVRVGRSALDEDAIRLIEAHNPDVEFDWTRILKGQDGSSEPRTAVPPDRRAAPPARDLPARRQENPGSIAGLRNLIDREESQPSAEPAAAQRNDLRIQTPAETIDAVIAVGPAELSEAQEIEDLLADQPVEILSIRPHAGDAISAVESRLGSEGLSRLRARYSEVMARISETISDPARQEELKTQAERLNPDTWVTEAEVTAGLESYESVFESLRSVVGRKRRRRRRSSERRRQTGGQSPDSAEPNDGALDDQEPGEDPGEEQ